MIYCIECQFSGWAHQEVNSGIIQQISMAYPNEPICVIAEKSHSTVLKAYSYNDKVRFMDYHFEKVECNGNGSDAAEDILPYIYSLSKLFGKLRLKTGDRIVILAANRGIIAAIGLLSLRYPAIKFFCIFHMFLEKVIEKGMREDSEKYITLRNVINALSLCKNVYFGVYSPVFKKYLKGKLNDGILKRFFFIHLPVLTPGSFEIEERRNSTELCIASWGAAVNESAKQIVVESLKQIGREECLFLLLDRSAVSYNFQDSRICVIHRSAGFTEKEMRDVIKRADWVLIPYNSEEYKVTASGILADAIRYEKPIIALNSPYIQYYNAKYHIGYVEDSICAIIERTKQIIEQGNRGEEFKTNLGKAKERMTGYNIEKLRKILK